VPCGGKKLIRITTFLPKRGNTLQAGGEDACAEYYISAETRPCVCVRSASVVFKCSRRDFVFCCSPCYEESSLACHSFECGAANLRTGCSMSDAGGVEQDPFRAAAASGEVELAETELDPTELDSSVSDVRTAGSFDRPEIEQDERIASRMSELSVSALGASDFEIDDYLETRVGARGENHLFVHLADFNGTISLYGSNYQTSEWDDLLNPFDALGPSTLQELDTTLLPEDPTTLMPLPETPNRITGSQRTKATRERLCCGTVDEPPQLSTSNQISDELLRQVASSVIRDYGRITAKHVQCLLCSKFDVHTLYKVCENSLVGRTRAMV